MKRASQAGKPKEAGTKRALSPRGIKRYVLENGPGSFEQRDALPVRLSPRERDILHHLAAGQTNEAITRALVLEESAVQWHLSRRYAKLQVQHRTQVVLQAKLHCLLSLWSFPIRCSPTRPWNLPEVSQNPSFVG